MLAHITEEVDHADILDPVQVVYHQRGIVAALEIQKPGNLPLDSLDPSLHDVRRIQLTLRSLETRITDKTGCPSHQGDRLMTGQLKTTQRQQWNKVTDMKALCSGIETAIQRSADRKSTRLNS